MYNYMSMCKCVYMKIYICIFVRAYVVDVHVDVELLIPMFLSPLHLHIFSRLPVPGGRRRFAPDDAVQGQRAARGPAPGRPHAGAFVPLAAAYFRGLKLLQSSDLSQHDISGYIFGLHIYPCVSVSPFSLMVLNSIPIVLGSAMH